MKQGRRTKTGNIFHFFTFSMEIGGAHVEILERGRIYVFKRLFHCIAGMLQGFLQNSIVGNRQ